MILVRVFVSAKLHLGSVAWSGTPSKVLLAINAKFPVGTVGWICWYRRQRAEVLALRRGKGPVKSLKGSS